MTNMLLMWLTTVLISKSIDFISCVKLIKDLYANGYKLNINNFREYKDAIGQNNNQRLSNYLPFFNILDSLQSSSQIADSIDFIFLNLKTLGLIEQMTKDELEVYEAKPNFFTILFLLSKSKENNISNFEVKVDNDLEKQTSIEIEFRKNSNFEKDKISVKISKGKQLTEEEINETITKLIDTIEKYPISKEDLKELKKIIETNLNSKKEEEKGKSKILKK